MSTPRERRMIKKEEKKMAIPLVVANGGKGLGH
jgi:hypothetical protein